MDRSANDYQCFLSGDEEGLSRIIRDHKDGLILYLNSFVQNVAVAEDLTEEIFVKLVLKRPRFRCESSFRTWLYAIGRNTAMDYLRSKHVDLSWDNCSDDADEEKDLERRYIQKEEKQVIHNCMKRLKPEYRQVLWLVYFEGFAHKEIARIMGKTVHSVETMVYRARQALRIKLLEEGFVYEEL